MIRGVARASSFVADMAVVVWADEGCGVIVRETEFTQNVDTNYFSFGTLALWRIAKLGDEIHLSNFVVSTTPTQLLQKYVSTHRGLSPRYNPSPIDLVKNQTLKRDPNLPKCLLSQFEEGPSICK